jgi:GT2 family glycosyltransferase
MISFPIAIVLYNPTSSTINRILGFLEKGIILYIFDNSKITNETLLNSNNPNLCYYKFNENLGLSYAINYLCEKALSNNFETLLFFDQDTIFKIESLNYINDFLTRKDLNSSFFDTVLSVNFRDSESIQSELNIIEAGKVNDYLYYNVYFNINSGTLYFLNKFKSFEWFEKKYFVDGVDYSLSLNTVINKFKNIVITNVPGLNHKDEQGDSVIQLFGKKISGRVYSLNRNFDFISSHLRLLIKTFKIRDYKPKFFIMKALFAYVIGQLVFRLKSIFAKIT